ncbi:12040_t:CDS:1, partial [Dentiscutata heterogama]
KKDDLNNYSNKCDEDDLTANPSDANQEYNIDNIEDNKSDDNKQIE